LGKTGPIRVALIVQVGVPWRFKSADTSKSDLVRTIALCAGSGGSVLKGAEADIYLTGEMSHVSILAGDPTSIHE
jgi:putative NIF3 family GTP cyclohydrolase 1 type 2